jgi:putative DNA primase/helicase
MHEEKCEAEALKASVSMGRDADTSSTADDFVEVPDVARVTRGTPDTVPRRHALDDAAPLDPMSFPHKPKGGGQVPSTIPNLSHMLAGYRITVRYNVIKKKLQVAIPGQTGAPDNVDNVALAQIVSLATLNNMPTAQIPSFLEVLGDRNLYNPAAEWIESKAWDGTDRLDAFCRTLQQAEHFPEGLKQTLVRRWLVSAVAAALRPSGFKTRGVLVLQGRQGIGKTAWVRSLISDQGLRESLIKLDHHLDAGSKDSVVTAITHWIVEIGELDSSFRRDVSRLKGFLTRDQDKVRRPYGKSDSEYPRRTVFVATVNEHDFLVDNTGNTRWWTIPVTAIDHGHGIDMQQLFAQIACMYRADEAWWLTQEEEHLLEEFNDRHRSVSALRERLRAYIDPEKKGASNLPAMSASDVLRNIGYEHPTNPQAKECASILRELLGDSKK